VAAAAAGGSAAAAAVRVVGRCLSLVLCQVAVWFHQTGFCQGAQAVPGFSEGPGHPGFSDSSGGLQPCMRTGYPAVLSIRMQLTDVCCLCSLRHRCCVVVTTW
jgi:hypothetical protein